MAHFFTFSDEASSTIDTSRVELYKLQVLARQTSTNNHRITVSGACVSRSARKIGPAITLHKENAKKRLELESYFKKSMHVTYASSNYGLVSTEPMDSAIFHVQGNNSAAFTLIKEIDETS